MNGLQIISLWPARLVVVFRRALLEIEIRNAERDLALTQREIAEKLEAKRHLTLHLLNLKAEQRGYGDKYVRPR